MGKLSEAIKESCCGNGIIDKTIITNKVAELEAENEELENELMDIKSEWSKNIEAHAKKCFMGGFVRANPMDCFDSTVAERSWLEYKALEL